MYVKTCSIMIGFDQLNEGWLITGFLHYIKINVGSIAYDII